MSAFAQPEIRLEIRNSQLGDAGKVADILSDAFCDDPVMNWMFGGPTPIRAFFRQFTRDVYLAHGFGHLAEDGAAALWLPPHTHPKLHLLSEMRVAASVLFSGGLRAINRARSTSKIVVSAHPTAPHYYLFAVGVRSAMQGRGVGGRIIREGLALADKDGAVTYLENSKPRNTSLYERLGFQSLRPLELPDGAPPLLAMLRPASSGLAQ